MTRYSRSVIPGRPSGESLAQEVDNLVFGKKGRAAANDEDDDDDDDDLDEVETDHLVKRANTDRRSKAERRAGKSRRQSDFAPLPGEGRGLREPSSKRGPILLVGAAVVVAVFGVVVWNAYREGVRPQDANTAPQLAEAGAFKSKPATVADEPSSSAAEASVFDQVEAPKPAVEPAPEIREEPKPPTAAATPPPAAKAPVQTTAPAKPAPAPAKPAATQSPATQLPVAQTPVAVAPPAQTAAAPKAETPKQEAISLIGGAAYTPAFSAGGKYVVQIAAASTEAGANAEWNKRVKAAPDLFPAAAEKIIVQADVDGRTVYRVRVGAFATAADADAFCGAIKAKGGACFRTAR